MPGTNLGLVYDAEIFNYSWKQVPDIIKTNMINSGAVAFDPEIQTLISNGSNYFTVPFYDNLGGDPQNYNGVTDFTYDALTGGYYAGVVYGRMKAWKAESFIKDFNSGADPMSQIISGVAQYWIKQQQSTLVKLLSALFVANDADFSTHTYDIATNTGTATDANKIGATTIGDAMVKANGDNAGGYAMAIMHSVVAGRLANLQMLEYSKYTDPMGITRPLPIGYINGLLVVINDNVPVDTKITYALTTDIALDPAKTYYTKAGDVYTAVAVPDVDDIATYYEQTDGPDEYTTFLLGNGAIRYAEAPVERPSSMKFDDELGGGTEMLYTRVRECMAPYGFSFVGDVTTDTAVPDSVLLAGASWERKMPAKSIMISRVITNG